jgi:hypothetical protein
MFSKLCALLRKKTEPLSIEPMFPVKKRPTIKKATTRVVSAKKTTPKKKVKK